MSVAAAVPPVLALVLLAAIAIAESVGAAPVGERPTDNLAEAAAAGEAATVVRLVGEGQDPTRPIPVRPEVIGLAVVSAVEAAVLSEDEGMIELLDKMGAIVGDQRTYLACLARDRENTAIAEYLVPAGLACEPGAAVAALRERNR